ncbi:MAG: hypothetical protein M3P43_06640 [Actinomycetota bacterium]|nr:hypothetical protein [Actinomycetota bacterium]
MRRSIIVLTMVLTLGLVAGAAPAAAGPVLPYNSHPHGHPYASWTRMVGQWFLGDASNPLFAGLFDGDCGEVMDGVFFMAAPIDVGVELDCDVPTGTPIVLSHAGWFVTEGIDGETDAELEAAAIAGFVTSTNSLTLDGKALPLQPIDTGAYDVISEPGGFYDTVGIGTGTIRTALRADLVFLHPLTPGDHVIEGAVSFVGDGEYSVTYNVHVG